MTQAGGPTPFERVGGEAGVRALVDHFYDLMDLEPAYAGLRALHPATLDGSRDKLSWFLCGWLGGPNHYVDRFGHPMLRARHLPYAIGNAERDQWMACMRQAMDDCEVPQDVREMIDKPLTRMCEAFRNR